MSTRRTAAGEVEARGDAALAGDRRDRFNFSFVARGRSGARVFPSQPGADRRAGGVRGEAGWERGLGRPSARADGG